MIKRLNEKKGFTLAELLIVVAIIAVLVAIAIPIFNTQLEKSREATDLANVRSAYAEVVAGYLVDGTSKTISVAAQQKKAGWEGSGSHKIGTDIGSQGEISVAAKTDKYTVTIDSSGTVTVN